eukprot:GHVU01069619.1.p1 GENE.GHVU01069619.1~~GHVU01069619.1.p1  ORF type:complete len:129 (-),score=4.09 GHVU01069619.1:24-410(-)
MCAILYRTISTYGRDCVQLQSDDQLQLPPLSQLELLLLLRRSYIYIINYIKYIVEINKKGRKRSSDETMRRMSLVRTLTHPPLPSIAYVDRDESLRWRSCLDLAVCIHTCMHACMRVCVCVSVRVCAF